MSWMDSWSRPNKHAPTPPPLYLTVGDTVPYCHSCGRVISERRKTQNATQVKYCSARCRNSKPGPTDRRIEAAFAALLEGMSVEQLKAQMTSEKNDDVKEIVGRESKDAKEGKKRKKKHPKSIKGDHRPVIECHVVEEIVFQREKDPEKVYGRRKNRKARFVIEKPEDWRSVDMVDRPTPSNHVQQDMTSEEESTSESDEHDGEGGGVVIEDARAPDDGPQDLPDVIEYGYGSGRVRPPQNQNDVNGSVGGEKGWAERIDETEDMKMKRREGQKRADEREMVRRAARRGCAFGFLVEVDGDDYEVFEKKGSKGKGGKQEEKNVGEERRKCEAVMKGVVVESSFAKGDWGIRWRERV